MSCHNFHLQSNFLLWGCRLGHLQDSSPLDAVILQRNTTGEEHSGGTEEAMLNAHKSMNKTLQELPQHSGLDACFPHALWPINFLSQLQCCTASTGACLCSCPSVNMQSEPENKTEVYPLDSEANGTILLDGSIRLATLLPSCALT